MSTVQKISIALPPKMAASLKKIVAKGDYSSASEVVREALRDWEDKQKRKKEQLKHLRQMLQEGIDSGLGKFNSMDEIIAEARRRHQAKNKSAAECVSRSIHRSGARGPDSHLGFYNQSANQQTAERLLY